jgi:hypothetical protein
MKNSLSVKKISKNLNHVSTNFLCFSFRQKTNTIIYSNSEFVRSLDRGSKIFVKSLNRQFLAISYSELLRYQDLFASFTVNHNELVMKLPLHFHQGNYATAAIDNWDHEDDSVCSVSE